jgi:hypothetical protein
MLNLKMPSKLIRVSRNRRVLNIEEGQASNVAQPFQTPQASNADQPFQIPNSLQRKKYKFTLTVFNPSNADRIDRFY